MLIAKQRDSPTSLATLRSDPIAAPKSTPPIMNNFPGMNAPSTGTYDPNDPNIKAVRALRPAPRTTLANPASS